jgi:thiol-disulfide isomerase/thioredoxin
MAQPAKRWRLRLVAVGLGTLAITAVVAFDLFVSTDLRLIYIIGAIVLFSAATWLAQKGPDWLAASLLFLPSVAGFSFYSLKVPALWLNVVLWAVVVAVGTVIVDLARKQRGCAFALIVALLIGSGWYCFSYAPKQLAHSFSRVKNASAPAFTLVPISERAPDGPKPGKVLVIDFFSTSCVPCIAELPEIAAAHSDLSSNNDIEFVLVGSERFVGNDTPERFRAFAQRRHFTLPLAFDPEGRAHDGFGLTGVPALVVLDRTGRVRFTHEGYNPAEANFRRDLVQFIKTLE